MLGRARTVLLPLLMMTLTAAPVVLNQCATSCQAHHEAIASTPSCPHHTAVSPHGAHLQHAPNACGHDHNGTLVTAESGGRVVTSLATALTSRAISLAPVTLEAVVVHAPPGHEPSSVLRVSILR